MRYLTTLVATALLFLAGAALAQNSAAERYLAEMNIIADALEGVSDDASAGKAAEVMAAALERMKPVAEEMQTWSEAEKMNFLKTYSEQYIGTQTRISQALGKMVQYPERLKLFTGHMKNMPRLDAPQ